MDKQQSIMAAYREGKLSAEKAWRARRYLQRFPEAPVSLAVSFAKLAPPRPVSTLSAKDAAFISSAW